MFPQALKTLSDGELVVGTHRYFLANFDIKKTIKTKDLWLICSVYIMKTGKTNEKYYNSEIPNSNSKSQ